MMVQNYFHLLILSDLIKLLQRRGFHFNLYMCCYVFGCLTTSRLQSQ